jgi:hypothetical protein
MKNISSNQLIFVFATYAMLSACADSQFDTTNNKNTPINDSESALLFEMNFNDYTHNYKTYNKAMVFADFNEKGSTIAARASGEIRGFDSADKSWPARNTVGLGHLKADFPANIASGKESGFLFDKHLPDMDVATMEYRIKFDDNFIWAAGGKLPGLGGAIEGAGIPVGCTKNQNNIKNGFSARLMWRRDGKLVLYTYFPDRKKNCGEDYVFFQALSGKWYTLTQTIKLNTPGKRDGQLWMYVNNELVYTKTDAFFREAGKENVKINTAIFHTYRGGKATDPRFHSPQQEYIYFDDFKIWQGYKQ